MGDALDHLAVRAAGAGHADERVTAAVQRAVGDASGLDGGPERLVGARRRVADHGPGGWDDEVVQRGLAEVDELEALGPPPGQHLGQLGVNRHHARVGFLFVVGLERLVVVLRVDEQTAEGLS